MTIHQPRSSIFQMFDTIMLLSEGNLIYFGGATPRRPPTSDLWATRCPRSSTRPTSTWTSSRSTRGRQRRRPRPEIG